jgi:hypothetical protein
LISNTVMETRIQSSRYRNLILKVFFILWITFLSAGYLVTQAPSTLVAIIPGHSSLQFLNEFQAVLTPLVSAELKK